MKVEILTLCDFAQTYRDRLTIVGAFSSINAQKFPVDITDVSFVAKIALEKPENRKHDVEIAIKKDEKQNLYSDPLPHRWISLTTKRIFLKPTSLLKSGISQYPLKESTIWYSLSMGMKQQLLYL